MLLLELRDAELQHEVSITKDEPHYTSELIAFNPDIILSPYSLKGTNAIKLLGIARKEGVDAPLILLAFDLSEDIAIDLLAEGIEDYVQQSTIKRLPVAIKKALLRHKTQLELQLSESRLRASEEAMRNMVRNAPIAVAMFDTDMNYLVISDFWLKHEEKTEDIIGKNHYDIVPEIPDSWKKVHQKVLKGETHGSEREKMFRADGSVEILRWKMNPWYTSENKIGGAVLFIEDITQKISTEKVLEKSQGLLSVGEELGMSGSFDFELATGKILWSENLYRLTGFNPGDEITNEKYFANVHPEDQEAYAASFEAFVETGKPVPFDYRFIRADNGRQVHFRVDSYMLKDDAGNPSHVIGSVQDMTKMHLAEAELKQSEASLKAAQKIAKVGSWEWVRDEKYISVSDEIKAIYETKKKRFTIEDIRSFIHPDDRNRVATEAANDFNDKIKPIIEYRVVTAKGNVKYVVTSAKQVFDADGNVTQLVGTIQDITERISIEKELSEKESLLQEMAESINDVFWVTNADGDKVLYMSPRYEEVYGMTIKSLYNDGGSWADNIHPDDRPMVFKEWEVNRLNGNYNVEFRLVHPNGEIKWLHAKAFPIKDENGEVVRMAGITHDITERREADNTLRKNELVLRQMAESINEVFYLSDWVNDKVLYTSPLYETVYDLSLENLYKDRSSWEKAVHPDDLEFLKKEFTEKAPLGTFDHEFRLVMKDGSVKWVRDRAFPIKDEDGVVVRMAGTTQDVTEMRKLLDSLSKNEQVLRDMAENITEVFWLTDWVENKVLYTSPRYESLYQLPVKDLYENGAAWEAAVHPEDLDRIAKLFRETAHLGTYDQEFRLVMKDGTVKWARDRAFPIKDENGTVVRMAGITEEITDQKKIREEIETLSLVASETVNGVIIHDADGTAMWANKGFTNITGYLPEEVVGKEPWSLLKAPETNEKLIEITYEKVKKGKPFTSDNQLLHKDGRVRWVTTSFAPILDAAGNVSKIVSIGTDISKQKELEELQRSMLTRMEARVNERTSELESINQELRKEIWENQRISDELYHHNLDLNDSIEYAKRIQESILPDENYVRKSFARGFVLFLPRDVVSGDFYWYYKRGNLSYFAAIDCTGHGVPGALMSMIANELMNQAIIQKKLTDPAQILTLLNKLMVRTLRQKSENQMRDGMDLSLIIVNHDTDTLQFSGAFSSMYLLQDKEMTIYPGIRHSIGGHLEEVKKEFTSISVKLKKGASIYLTTDGYIDQFGGPEGKKLMKKRFAQFLTSIQSLPMDKQKETLLKQFNEWKGSLNQVDDVLVVGLNYDTNETEKPA